MSDTFGSYVINDDGSITISLGQYNKNCTPEAIDVIAREFLCLARYAQTYSERHINDEYACDQDEVIQSYLDCLPEFDRWVHDRF